MKKTSIIWHKGVKLPDLNILQAYVFAVTSDKKILLVRDYDEERYTLPGGAIEQGETPERGILRELKEEAQVTGAGLVLLGSIEVKQFDGNGELIEHHQQLRYACRADVVNDFIPQKDGFETQERIAVDMFEVPTYIHWMKKPNGLALFSSFLEYASEL